MALSVLTLVFCAGIFFAPYTALRCVFLWGAAVIVWCASLIFKRQRSGFLLLAVLVFLFGILFFKTAQLKPRLHLDTMYFARQALYNVKGVVAGEVLTRHNRSEFVFLATELQQQERLYRCRGKILVYISGSFDFPVGSELILTGTLWHPFSRKDFSRKSYAEYLHRQGIYSIMNVRLPPETIGLKKRYWLRRFSLSLKHKIERIFKRYLSSLGASVAEAMVLGEKKDIPPLLYRQMMYSGTVHILVVSGSNVGIVICVVLALLKLLRIPRKVRPFLAMPVLLLYCVMTGASNPVVRATVMAGVFLGAPLLKRELNNYNSLSLAALCILLVNPAQLFDVGFQLSFASVLALIALYPKIRSWLKVKKVKFRWLRYIAEGALVSFSAWLGTAGLVAYYFKLFAPVTLIANIFIVPLAALITLASFSIILFSFIFPPFAHLSANSCDFLVFLLVKVNSFMINLPYAYSYL